MANAQKIDEVVDLKKIEGQIDVFESRLRGLQGEFAKTTASVIPLNNAIASSKSFKEFEANSQKAALEIEKLNQAKAKSAILEETLSQKRIKRAELEDTILKKQIAAEEKLAAKEAERQALLDKKTKTIVSNSQAEIEAYQKSTSGTAKVNTKLEEQRAAYDKLTGRAVAYGNSGTGASKKVNDSFVASTRAVKLAGTSIESLKEKLVAYKAIAESTQSIATQEKYNLKIQQTEKQISQLSNVGKVGFDNLGNAVKNNGNAFQKAFSSLRFIANILPGIGIAGLLGFAVGPIIDYVSKLDLFKKKIDEIKKTRETLNSISLKGAQDAQAEIVSLRQLYIASQNTNLSLSDRKKAVDEIQKQYPSYFGNLTDEAILAGKGAAAYDKLTKSIIATATARAGEDIIVENSKTILENEQKITDLREKNNGIIADIALGNTIATIKGGVEIVTNAFKLNTANVERIKNEREIGKLASDNIILNLRNLAIQDKIQKLGVDAIVPPPKPIKEKKEKDNSLRDEQLLLKARLEREKQNAREILENDNSTIEARLLALQIYSEKSTELIDLDTKSKLKEPKISKDKIAAIIFQGENEKKDIELAGNKERQKITKEFYKSVLDVVKENGNKRVNEEIVQSENRIAAIEKEKQKALVALAEQYAQGLITTKQYEKQRFEIEKNATADSLKEQLKSTQLIIDTKKKAGLDTTSDEKKAADLQAKIDTDLSGIKIKNAEEVAARRKELEQKGLELSYAVYDLGVDLVKNGYDQQSDAIRGQMDLTDKRQQKELEDNENSLKSQEEKAKATEIINARAQAQKEFLERKQRLIDLQRARFEKAADIGKIIGSTAVGVVKALADLNIPLSILIGAIGAVQLATVVARPIPKFKDGVKSSKEGLAIVGDGYEHELRINPDGTQELTPNKPTLTYLQAGTEIIGGKELKQIAAKQTFKEIKSVSNQLDTDRLIRAQLEASNVIKKALLSRPENKTILTERGLKYMYKNGKGWTEYLKRNN